VANFRPPNRGRPPGPPAAWFARGETSRGEAKRRRLPGSALRALPGARRGPAHGRRSLQEHPREHQVGHHRRRGRRPRRVRALG